MISHTGCLKQRDSIYCSLPPSLSVLLSFSVPLSLSSFSFLISFMNLHVATLTLIPSLSFCSSDFLCLYAAISLYFSCRLSYLYICLQSQFSPCPNLFTPHFYCLFIHLAHPCPIIPNCLDTAAIKILFFNVFQLVILIWCCLGSVQSDPLRLFYCSMHK